MSTTIRRPSTFTLRRIRRGCIGRRDGRGGCGDGRVGRRTLLVAGLLLGASVAVPSFGTALADDAGAQARCRPPAPQEPTLGYSDFTWSYTRDELDDKFDEIYGSGKRLIDRARWDEGSGGYHLIHRGRGGGETVPVSEAFIGNLRSHIERALALGYADHVFFPDMGHAHLLIDEDYYDAVVRDIPTSEFPRLYTEVLARPQTRFLYHTAEQLDMLDGQRRLRSDKYLGWRYFTRNLVARNDGLGLLDIHHDLESLGNTVCGVDGPYRYFSAGYQISASEEGCFPYSHDGRTYYFDISLSDLPLGSNDPVWLGAGADGWGHGAPVTVSRLWGAHGCAE